MNMVHFNDRADAGTQLAAALGAHAGKNTLVLGIPGGGVVVGAPIAAALGVPLRLVQVDPVARANRRRAATERMRSRAGSARSMFSSGASNVGSSTERSGSDIFGANIPNVEGRTVIVVDDGLHDDLEVHRTLIAFRGRGAAKLILAVPFIGAMTAEQHRSEVDEVVTLHTLVDLIDPSEMYGDATSPSIEQVQALLAGEVVEVETEQAPKLYQNILVPVDFSDASVRAVREALRLQAVGGGMVTLMNVSGATPSQGDDSAAIHRQQPLVTFAEGLIPEGADVTLKLGTGDPAREIVREVINGDHDLVVMGTNGRRGLQNALFGSVAAAVVRTSLAPVLVTH
jgi:putative phosphoribosyl transferase